MDRKLKLLAASSVVALTTTACAPNGAYAPYNQQYPATSTVGSDSTGPVVNSKAPVTHSHGGKVHTHALPGTGLRHTHTTGAGNGGTTVYRPPVNNYRPPVNNYRPPANTYQPPANTWRPPAGNNNGGTTHSHCGRTHTHPLPAQGLNHTHGNANCPAGAASNTQQQGNYNPPPVQNNTNNGYYDYAYNGGQQNPPAQPPQNNSYYSYGNENTAANPTYYDNANTQPKAPASYYDNSTGGTYDYSSPNSSYETYATPDTSTTTSTTSFAPNNYKGGNTYTVQKGDTVFQVMRNTGVYWKDIIRMNNLQAPNYQINPGQALRLK